MKSAEEKRKDDCYGDLRCWNWVQTICPVYDECKAIAGVGKNHPSRRQMVEVKQTRKDL